MKQNAKKTKMRIATLIGVALAVLWLAPTSHSQSENPKESREAAGDRIKLCRSLSIQEKLIVAFKEEELLKARAPLADLSNAGENPHGTAFLSPRRYSTNPVYDTKLETKADGLAYKSRVVFDEQSPPLQGFLANNFIPAVKRYCEGGHLTVEFDTIEFSIAKRPNTEELSVHEDLANNILGTMLSGVNWMSYFSLRQAPLILRVRSTNHRRAVFAVGLLAR